MATARESTLYANHFTNKYLAGASDLGGRAVPLRFAFTVVSASATGDTYTLTQIPATAKVVGLECTTDGLGASAGAGVTLKIGDADDDDRYMAATDFDAANAAGTLAFAGAGYEPSVDTVVVGTITNAAVVGKKVAGVLWIVPGA